MKHVCKLCGYVYDDSLESTPFDQLPEDWVCPVCDATKDDFEVVESSKSLVLIKKWERKIIKRKIISFLVFLNY